MRIIARSLEFTCRYRSTGVPTREERGTHDAINVPNTRPRPGSTGRLPLTNSFAAAGPTGWVKAFDTASLSLRLSVSRYEPSCTKVAGTEEEVEVGGDVRLKELSDNILRGWADRSTPMPESRREGVPGVGEVGRLAGRKKLGFLRVSGCIRYLVFWGIEGLANA
jgi:hypothetical protein